MVLLQLRPKFLVFHRAATVIRYSRHSPLSVTWSSGGVPYMTGQGKERGARALQPRQALLGGFRHPIGTDVLVSEDDLRRVVARQSRDIASGMAA